jgi:hypothetical protein
MARKKTKKVREAQVVCKMYDNSSWGLIVGVFMGGFHTLWALLVASGLAQPLMNWIFDLHMIVPPYTIAPFDILKALTLVIVTFVIGYISGWVLAGICNAFCKK